MRSALPPPLPRARAPPHIDRPHHPVHPIQGDEERAAAVLTAVGAHARSPVANARKGGVLALAAAAVALAAPEVG